MKISDLSLVKLCVVRFDQDIMEKVLKKHVEKELLDFSMRKLKETAQLLLTKKMAVAIKKDFAIHKIGSSVLGASINK